MLLKPIVIHVSKALTKEERLALNLALLDNSWDRIILNTTNVKVVLQHA